jgi:uncharacterized protein YjbI with pentapeptide repeats
VRNNTCIYDCDSRKLRWLLFPNESVQKNYINMKKSIHKLISKIVLFRIQIVISVLAILFLSTIWNAQQQNANLFQNKIKTFKAKVEESKEIDEKLKLDKDILVIEKDETSIQNSIYITLVQTVGGLILIVTAYVGYRNFMIGEENLKIGQKNLKVSEDKQVTERFSKSIEHLGNKDAINVRLGGIYALEQIAIDSPKYHWTIVEILSAFVREKSTIDKSDSEGVVFPERKTTIDIKAAIAVIARRDITYDEKKIIDLRQVYLEKMEFESKANLNGVNLSGAILSGAELIEVNLNGAILSGAELIEVKLSGANLSGANLSGAYLNGAELIGVDLNGANLSGAELIGVDLNGANLSRADLSGANLREVKNFTSLQIKLAFNWEKARYDHGILENLLL